MKIFIVFFAILVLNISFLCFNNDMDRYVKLQSHLKSLAEESAAGASLFKDEEKYSQGILVINDSAAIAYIDFIIKKAMENSQNYRDGIITKSIFFFDDLRGYDQASDLRIDHQRPCVVVSLTFTGKDMFRLPFICVKSISRTASYQWDDVLTSSF